MEVNTDPQYYHNIINVYHIYIYILIINIIFISYGFSKVFAQSVYRVQRINTYSMREFWPRTQAIGEKASYTLHRACISSALI